MEALNRGTKPFCRFRSVFDSFKPAAYCYHVVRDFLVFRNYWIRLHKPCLIGLQSAGSYRLTRPRVFGRKQYAEQIDAIPFTLTSFWWPRVGRGVVLVLFVVVVVVVVVVVALFGFCVCFCLFVCLFACFCGVGGGGFKFSNNTICIFEGFTFWPWIFLTRISCGSQTPKLPLLLP